MKKKKQAQSHTEGGTVMAGKGGKDDKGKDKKGKGKDKKKKGGDSGSYWSDTVAIILKRDCAEALYAALVIALGTLPTPKKKKKDKKKGKKDKGKKDKGKKDKGKDKGKYDYGKGGKKKY
jgi:hypothetical protein